MSKKHQSWYQQQYGNDISAPRAMVYDVDDVTKLTSYRDHSFDIGKCNGSGDMFNE